MKAFRTILFAADFSESSKEAFRVACSLAREEKTRLCVLTVADPEWVGEDPVFFGQSKVQFYKQGNDEHRLEMLKDKLRGEYTPDHAVDVEYRAREGEIPHEIVTAAHELGADLIVMGTHGRTGMSWLISGSVATAVSAEGNLPGGRPAVHCSDAQRRRISRHPSSHGLLGEFSSCARGRAISRSGSRCPPRHPSRHASSDSDGWNRGGRDRSFNLPRLPGRPSRSPRWSGPQVPDRNPAGPGI